MFCRLLLMFEVNPALNCGLLYTHLDFMQQTCELLMCSIFFMSLIGSHFDDLPNLVLQTANEADSYAGQGARLATIITVTPFLFTSLLFLVRTRPIISLESEELGQPIISITNLRGCRWRPLVQFKVWSLFMYLGTALPCLEGRGMEMRLKNVTKFRRRPWGLIRGPGWTTHYRAESPSHCACGGKTSFMQKNIN